MCIPLGLSEWGMSGSAAEQSGDSGKARNLPSWMSARENASKTHGKKPIDEIDRRDKHLKKLGQEKKASASTLNTPDFSKLMDGVVFVLSGFVNPERSSLRSQALEMGATYKPDWNSDCTLLVCAFPNTPKYRQVQLDGGTIVSKEWISECYNQKKLVDIERYLMHVGKPWRKSKDSLEASQEVRDSRKTSKKLLKLTGERSEAKATSAASKGKAPSSAEEQFPVSEVKGWVKDDLDSAISWLKSQEEKPEASEIERIAAGGILTCLQDAIDSLEQNQDVERITEQWSFIPRGVEELAKIERSKKRSSSVAKQLCQQAKAWKSIYDEELNRETNDSPMNWKRKDNSEKSKRKKATGKDEDSVCYDSEETIEMTEEEIERAFASVASNLSASA